MADHPWIQSYPEGVRWDAPLETYPVAETLDRAAARWPEASALDFMGRKITYRELLSLADRAASGFQALGVGPGVHVGLFLPNTPHYAIAFFGALKAGATVVNYSPLDAEKALEHKIEDSHTDVMVTLDLAALYPQMAKLLGRTRLKHLVVGDLAEYAAQPAAVRAHLAKAGTVVDAHGGGRELAFAKLLDNDGKHRVHPLGNLEEAIAVLQYTGGTTGAPKGAMLTHANLSVVCSQIVTQTGGTRPIIEEGKERVLVVLPLFHVYALTVNLLFGLRIGAELVLHTRFDLADVVRDIAAKKITILPGVPTMFTAIANHPDAARLDLSSLKFCASGGAPLPVALQERFQQLTGCRLKEGWGMTETSPSGTFTPLHGPRKAGSCGIPVPGLTIRFASLEDPGRYAAPGERGELVVKGPNVMRGYWNRPEATAESFNADGFFRTGDVGYMDAEGYVFIVDRCKDMILCGGYNVYPRLIEEAVLRHPGIAEACVIGVPDPYRGQAPKAFVVAKTGAPAPSLDELKAFLADKLGKHEMVQELEVRASLPKTAVGKLSKKDLYDEEARKRSALQESTA